MVSTATRIGIACLLSAALSGCGDGRPGLVEATGTVTVDGKPVEGASVSFQPIAEEMEGFGRPAVGTTDASGKFSLMTYEPGDGVPEGKYKVAVQKRVPVNELPANYDSEQAGTFKVKFRWDVPRLYANPESSGLTAEVTSSGIEPATFALTTNGVAPEIETEGATTRRANDP